MSFVCASGDNDTCDMQIPHIGINHGSCGGVGRYRSNSALGLISKAQGAHSNTMGPKGSMASISMSAGPLGSSCSHPVQISMVGGIPTAYLLQTELTHVAFST